MTNKPNLMQNSSAQPPMRPTSALPRPSPTLSSTLPNSLPPSRAFSRITPARAPPRAATSTNRASRASLPAASASSTHLLRGDLTVHTWSKTQTRRMRRHKTEVICMAPAGRVHSMERLWRSNSRRRACGLRFSNQRTRDFARLNCTGWVGFDSCS